MPGDLIVAINDRPVATVAKLLARLDDFAPGEKVKVTVLRGGRRVNVEVALAAE